MSRAPLVTTPGRRGTVAAAGLTFIMQNAIFWITAGAFLAAQLGMLLYLLAARQRARRSGPGASGSSVEIVWTMVPAALLVVLVLMMGGWLEAGWSQRRPAPEATLARQMSSAPQSAGGLRWTR